MKKKYRYIATGNTTPLDDTNHQTVRVDRKALRKAENEEYLKDANVQALLGAIAWAEGGNYHAKYGYGWAKGDWSFKDESTHPGAGYGGSTTAAGMYQITKQNWEENGTKKMGISDFSPKTQDLIAIEGLRHVGSIDAVVAGDIGSAISKAAATWNALPLGKDKANRVHGQPYKKYEAVVEKYKSLGGTTTRE